MDKENLRELLSQIRQEDTQKLQNLYNQLQLRLETQATSNHVADVLFWIEVSKRICSISYKKKSIKDRYKDVPWHQLEFLHKVLSTYLHAKYILSGQKLDWEQRSLLDNLQTDDFLLDDKTQLSFLVQLCEFAWNEIHPKELKELRDRISEILQEEQQRVTTKEGIQQYQWKQHVPPAYGLVSVCKLSGYFLDHHELQTVLIYSKQALEELRSKTVLQIEEKFGVLRVLAIIGESTKYLTNSTKSLDPSIPWKNVEKIRDLLSHVSRLPMRQAVNLVLELKDPPHIARLLDEVRAQITQQSPEKPVAPSKNKKNKNQLDNDKELFKFKIVCGIIFGCSLLLIVFTVWDAATDTLQVPTLYILLSFGSLLLVLVLLLRKRQQVLKQTEQKKRFLKKLQQIESAVEPSKIPPSNLLNNIALRDLPLLHYRIHRILRIHEGVKYRLYPSLLTFFLLATLSSILSTSLSNWIWMLLPVTVFGLVFVLEGTSNILRYLPSWFLKTFFIQKQRSAKEVWGSIPSPPSKPEQVQLPETGETQEKVEEPPLPADDKLFQYFSATEKERYVAIWNSQIQISQEDKKLLLSQVTEKGHRKLWSEKLFYMKPKQKEKASELSKEQRLQKFLEVHENSTLNREFGLESFIELRSFLQLPAEDKLSVKDVCVPLALEGITVLEQLLIKHNMLDKIQPNANQTQLISLLQNNVLLHHTIEYYIGLYALYAAQIKWHFPEALGNEHMEIRDHFMHGTNHSYSSHFTPEGLAHTLKQVAYILLEVKPHLQALGQVQ